MQLKLYLPLEIDECYTVFYLCQMKLKRFLCRARIWGNMFSISILRLFYYTNSPSYVAVYIYPSWIQQYKSESENLIQSSISKVYLCSCVNLNHSALWWLNNVTFTNVRVCFTLLLPLKIHSIQNSDWLHPRRNMYIKKKYISLHNK